MPTFSEQLAGIIGDLSDWPADPCFDAALVYLTRKLRDQLVANGEGIDRAEYLATRAVEIACKRDGIEEQAKEALKGAMAR